MHFLCKSFYIVYRRGYFFKCIHSRIYKYICTHVCNIHIRCMYTKKKTISRSLSVYACIPVIVVWAFMNVVCGLYKIQYVKQCIRVFINVEFPTTIGST